MGLFSIESVCFVDCIFSSHLY